MKAVCLNSYRAYEYAYRTYEYALADTLDLSSQSIASLTTFCRDFMLFLNTSATTRANTSRLRARVKSLSV